MSGFDAHLLSPRTDEHLSEVQAFVGEDRSGQFGLRAHHEPFLTVLVPGLSRLRFADQHWEYLAQPGAVAHFVGNQLTLVTRDFLRSADFETVSHALEQRFAAEEEALRDVHDRLEALEREMLRRLWRLQREAR